MFNSRSGFIKSILGLLLAGLLLNLIFSVSASGAKETVYVVPVEEMITSGTAGFVGRQIEEAQERGVAAVVLLMNTPGGLMEATLDLHRQIRAAEIPVLVFVAPTGAIAASAGAFILLSADIAAMSPGTTVGAAQPVAVAPGGGVAPAEEKTENFFAGHIRSIARENDRPEDIAEKFVTENLVLSYEEALNEGVIDLVSGSVKELLEEVDGWEVKNKDGVDVLRTSGANVIEKNMNLREKIQNWVSNPQISFLLMMLGLLGIYFGLSIPGTYVPEVLGAIALIMGIYGMGLFDTNTAGIVLMLVGVALLATEIFTTGFGIFGVGGAICLAIGAMLLPMEPLMSPDWYRVFQITVLGVVIAVGIILIVVARWVVTSRKAWHEGGAFFRTPKKAVVVEALAPDGLVSVRGELWKARHTGEGTIQVGEEVEVTGQEGLVLFVQRGGGLADNEIND